jgi:PAS domain S-box-containing protein
MTMGLIPPIILIVAMALQLIFTIKEPIFNPPYLPLILQAVFVLGTSLVVAYVSAKGYVHSGSRNLVFLGTALLINGVITTISVIPFGWSSNNIVTMANLGILASAIIQFLGATIAFTLATPRENINRKPIVVAAYIGSILLIGLIIVLVFSGWLPVFLTPTGPTPMRLAILGVIIILLFGSSLLFAWRYFRVKSLILYWYSLGLALFGLAIVAAFLTVGLGDIMNWISRLAIYISGVYFLLAVLITEPEKADVGISRRWGETFRSNREQIERLFANMIDAFIYCKVEKNNDGKAVDWVFLDVNESYLKIVGLKREEVIGKKATELFPNEPKDPSDWIGRYGKVALTGEAARFESFRGSLEKWLSVSAYSPKRGYFVSVFQDITERKKAEESLQLLNEDLEERVQKRTLQVSSERQRLYSILEALPAYVILLDKDYHATFANKVFRERFGESNDRRCYDFLFNRDLPCENCETYKVFKTNSSHHWEWTGPDHRAYDVYDFLFLEADGSKLVLEMGLNITERKLAEKMARESAAKLKDSERLAAIGTTAGMVGHDIRNPLQAITSDVYLAKTDLNEIPDSEQKKNVIESLDGIEDNVVYINKIVQDLQDYAKPITPEAKETDIASICEVIQSKNGIPNNIEFSCVVDNDVNFIADPDLVKRILDNLVINAVQAMPNGGKLDVRAFREASDTVLTVKDTGVGILDSARSKLFTPMFTTKSKGQGFGLAVVKRMTEALGGTVTFESQEGEGTTFILRFPLQRVNGKYVFK